MRLIDADKLADEIAVFFERNEKLIDEWVTSTIEDEIETAPTVDRPQGEWIKRFGSINCSVCKHCSWSESFEYTVRRFKFCPNCGARMDGET